MSTFLNEIDDFKSQAKVEKQIQILNYKLPGWREKYEKQPKASETERENESPIFSQSYSNKR